jgi:hypothetical protein
MSVLVERLFLEFHRGLEVTRPSNEYVYTGEV